VTATAIREYRIPLDGVASRALELRGSGPPILLLHGFTDSADTWLPVLERLAAADRWALAIDLPGFGHADDLDRRAPVLPQLDRAVKAALRRFPPGSRPIVAGNSMGGLAALRVAQDPALALGAVVPIAAAGLTYTRWLRIIQETPQVQALLLNGWLLRAVPLPGPVFRYLVSQAYRNLVFARPSSADAGVLTRFATNIGGPGDVVRMLQMAQRALPELADPVDLQQITCEVLAIWGSEDRLVSPAGARTLVEALPDARVRMIEGCGHCPQVEMPDEIARALEDVAARVTRS
jgi:pimeloyl-ACP methyl ester carboxylesterase